MSQRPIVYPPLPEDLQQGLSWRSLKYFGAGAIVASVTIASGETIFAARSGALFGYTLLWCFVAGALMKGVQVYSGMRHMVLTGEHPDDPLGLHAGAEELGADPDRPVEPALLSVLAGRAAAGAGQHS